ncbi:hypothetical protein CKM354_000602300 [Cercospora kikuchii]|uniref:BTB domain-containing protein n=1 Tax=Cercospora kikuchii TaxID=84275 RepID=A0A9P3FCX3_9PEZI|nr:uncharacterized protein CKM354_000602300 [Cercospora kikuchii]GIZ42766.1 hypothetical protein CKM354_000602300 [Cercospora kikuchii]
MSAIQPPTNKQQPFKGYLCPHSGDTSELCHFQSITASPMHSHHSAEELRLQDYCSARRPIFARDRSKIGEALKLTKEDSSSGSGKYRGPVILFVVGTESVETFAIHKQLIAAKSEFVRLALQGGWREAKDGVISLPDDDPKTFEIYQAWLYDRKIYTDLWVDGIHDKESRRLMVAWVLGDKLQDTDFKDALMDALVGRIRDTQAFASLRLATSFIYSKTPDGSAPRRLLTDIYTYHGASWWVDEVMSSGLQETYAVDFLKDLSKRQLTQRGPSSLNSAAYMAFKPGCAYHDHKPGKCFRVILLS